MDYIGHPLQIRGAEQFVLQGGKGDGMHFVSVRNGLGLECLISLDRCADLARVTYNGKNMGYMSPCGNVAPQYYDKDGAGFLKSFTAGFFTTAGLSAVGSPCEDDGEVLPLHGSIANTPAELNAILENDDGIEIIVTVRDCVIFGRKLILKRKYVISYTENIIEVKDSVTNEADTISPFMILYHCNMGYPLLCEKSIVTIPNNGVLPRNEHAAKYIETALEMEKPQTNFEECCYYYDVKDNNGTSKAGIYNEGINAGVIFTYNKNELPYFTQWKMMGKKDYALGLEPGNCTPDGRDVLRKNGTLKFLEPDETATSGVTFKFVSSADEYKGEF